MVPETLETKGPSAESLCDQAGNNLFIGYFHLREFLCIRWPFVLKTGVGLKGKQFDVYNSKTYLTESRTIFFFKFPF